MIFSLSHFNILIFSHCHLKDYQRDADKTVKVLLGHIIGTQMFVNLIQERQEVPSYHLLFFDKAVRRLKDLNLSLLPADNRHNPKYRQQQPTLGYEVVASTPLYEHVIILDTREASFLMPTDAMCNESRHQWLKEHRETILGSVTNFEHAISHDDRSDSHDMTVEKGTDRQELVGQFNLNLDDITKGALIIPGPLLKERNIDRDGDAPTDREYIYDTVWPIFDHSITHEVTHDTVRSELRNIRDRRKVVSERLDSICTLFIREDSERNCYKFNRRLLNSFRAPLHYDAKDSVQLAKISAECTAAISMAAGIFTFLLVLLSTRALRETEPTRDIIQAMGILSHLDRMNLLNQVDETTWRTLIIASNTLEGGYFKSNIIRLLLASVQSSGIVPSILTSTQRSANGGTPRAKGSAFKDEKILKASAPVILDSFWHLEEIGLTWFSHKILPFETAAASSTLPLSALNSHYDSGPKAFRQSTSSKSFSSPSTTSPMRRLSNMFKRNSVDHQLVRKVRRKSVKALGAAVECTKFMQLMKNRPYFSLHRPQGPMVLFTVPQIVPSRLYDRWRGEDLSSVNIDEVENKVQSMRDIFNKIQRLNETLGRERRDIDGTVVNVASESLIGEVELVLRGASHLSTCSTTGSKVKLTTLYSRLWTTMSSHITVKSAPGIRAWQELHDFSLDNEKSCEVIQLKIQDIAKDEVCIDLFGDFTRDSEENCHTFDALLGKGRFALSDVLGSGQRHLDLQLFSSEGEKSAVMHFYVDFKAIDNDFTANISSQKSVESFFNSNSDSHIQKNSKQVSSRPASVGSYTSNTTHIESRKRTWKEKLSFGLYKDKGNKDSDNSESAGSVTPPPMKQIIESVEDSDTVQSTDLQDVIMNLNMNDSCQKNDVAEGTAADIVNDKDEVRDGCEVDSITVTTSVISTMTTTTVSTNASADDACSVDSASSTNLKVDIESAQQEISKKLADLYEFTCLLIKEQKVSVGIYSCTPCLVCGFCMTDDEMMAEWAGFPSLAGGMKQQCDDVEQDIVAAHTIVCAKCQSNISPLLHVQQYKLINADNTQTTTPHLEVAYEVTVPYLSPFGVRYKIESAIAEHGTDVLSTASLSRNCPLLLWNILWYSTRLDLPSGLIPSDWLNFENSRKGEGVASQLLGPVTVSWRECMARSKAMRAMLGEDFEIGLSDVFPGANVTDLQTASQIASEMDGSVGGFSAALTLCAQLKSLRNCFQATEARGLYLTLLMLSHFSNLTQYVDFQCNNLYIDLPKVSGLGCARIDTHKCNKKRSAL